jgi:hypothetical protein
VIVSASSDIATSSSVAACPSLTSSCGMYILLKLRHAPLFRILLGGGDVRLVNGLAGAGVVLFLRHMTGKHRTHQIDEAFITQAALMPGKAPKLKHIESNNKWRQKGGWPVYKPPPSRLPPRLTDHPRGYRPHLGFPSNSSRSGLWQSCVAPPTASSPSASNKNHNRQGITHTHTHTHIHANITHTYTTTHTQT